MKNNFKKGLSLIVTIAMMFSLVTGLNAFAEGEKSLTVVSTISDNSTVKVGDTITQTISLTDFSANIVDGVRSFALSIKFDPTKLEATKASVVTAGNIGGVNLPEAGAGEVTVVDTNSPNIPDGTLNVVYTDKGETVDDVFKRTPAKAGAVLVITYTALLVEGATDVSVEALQDPAFIDCEFPNVPTTQQVPVRTITSNLGTTTASTPVTSTITVIPAGPTELEIKGTSTYQFDTTGGYVYGIEPGTAVADVINNFENSADVQVTGAVDGIVGTGCAINLVVEGSTIDTVTVVIIGDVDGNGIITLDDYSLLQQRVIELISFEGAFNLAANTDGTSDGLITLDDYSQLQQRVIELITLPQVPPIPLA